MWRGSVEPINRLYGSLPYVLPMAAAVPYGFFLFTQFPPFLTLFYPFLEVRRVLNYPILPPILTLNFVVFLCLFFFVIRNEKVHHFIRFNAMQSLLLGIGLILIELVSDLLTPLANIMSVQTVEIVIQIFATTLFVGMASAFFYSVVQCIRGTYAEMPIISEAAYIQVRY